MSDSLIAGRSNTRPAVAVMVFAVSLAWLLAEPGVAAADENDAGANAAASSSDREPATAGRVDFVRDIQPIFVNHCYECHGPDLQEGQLRLDAKSTFEGGGVSGEAFVSGKGAESLLYQRIAGLGDLDQMPLDADPLSAEQIALIRRWIDEGANWPDGVGAMVEERSHHWAYQKPVRPELPAVGEAAWTTNAIDYFVLHRLEEEGLEPSPPADRARLVRRLYLDLIGLPPTIEEVAAFVNDRRPEAYEALVDHLLASPHYGERWARPWLDLARYADSNGYQRDGHRVMWAYRDWVIQAFNDDMPFDEFTIEQIAGDLLPNATRSQRIATGFHRCTTVNVEAGTDVEENRIEPIVDRVNTTGTVWLGTSIGCAQCHNHKYDPFTTKEYYQLFAYFNNTEVEIEPQGSARQFSGPMMELPLPAEQQARRDALRSRYEKLKSQYESTAKETGDDQERWEADVARALQNPPQWHVLPVAEFESQGGASHRMLDDQSVLVGGTLPKNDTYTITVRTDLDGIAGFKLEAMTDPSLPGDGPGRGDAGKPNFILNEFRVDVVADAAEGEPHPRAVELRDAFADFSQKGWDVEGAIDGDTKSGWAINPEFHKPHEATILTVEPVDAGGPSTLVFTLEQNYGGGRTIGRLRLSALTGNASAVGLPDEIAKILAVPAEERKAKDARQVADYYHGLNPRLKRMSEAMEALEKQLDNIAPPTTLVMEELDTPRPTAIFRRGNFLDRGEEVQPGVPATLHPLPADAPPNRLGLARWLVDENNPLVGRVTVNRWWAEFFGAGIVTSPEDFGTQGDLPTHPGLLDWLAVEFIERGWSMKHIHKLIAMSSTYRQSSVITPELLARDPYNRLYARGPRFRLSAEAIRDNALAVSGLLCTKLGGPPVYPPQPAGIWRVTGAVDNTYRTSTGEDRYRRGVYTVWRRSAAYPSFVNFDAPDRAACVVQRRRTNTPLQALTLLNDPAFVEMSVALASRMLTDHPGLDDAQRAAYGFELCTAREPAEEEVRHLEEVYRRELARYASDGEAARALVEGGPHPDNVDVAELAAWTYVANLLLNLDETITKG